MGIFRPQCILWCMRLGKRELQDLKLVLGQKETYRAVLRAFRILDSPLSLLCTEVLSSSLRRDEIWLRTPIGRIPVRLNTSVDLSTVMGVFCRDDYWIGPDAKVVVDVGANIGIASLYFLTRSLDTLVYAYEPVPQNIESFRQNIAPFQDRCELAEVAVGAETGVADFGIEPTGKFGGIKVVSKERIRIRCVSVNDVLERVFSKHPEIDCLKIDVEGTEQDILSAVAREFWDRIKCIYAENCNSEEFLPPNFRRTFRYNVERLARL